MKRKGEGEREAGGRRVVPLLTGQGMRVGIGKSQVLGTGWGGQSREVSCCGRWSQDFRVRHTCAVPLANYTIRVRCISFPEPQTTHPSNGDNKPYSRCCWDYASQQPV